MHDLDRVILIVTLIGAGGVTLGLLGPEIGLDPSIANMFTILIPSIVVFCIGAWAIVAAGRGVGSVFGFMLLGVSMALFIQGMSDANILIADIFGPTISVPEVQVLVIALSTMLGGVVAAFTR